MRILLMKIKGYNSIDALPSFILDFFIGNPVGTDENGWVLCFVILGYWIVTLQ